MSDNRELLIRTLCSLPLLDGRYADIQCVNYDVATGAKRGHFSLVFRARDTVESCDVALKFFDVDPLILMQTYRRQAFEREHEILKVLLTKERCLQLGSALNVFSLNAGGTGPTLGCSYFAVEWVDTHVDNYFEEQQRFEAKDKLLLFNDIVLAIEALHRHSVFHRDIKADNLRAYVKDLKRVVVAIDLGTAALYSSPSLLHQYGSAVGHLAYSPPEAICGLAGERRIASLSDNYALGCLLFELFNLDLYARAFATRNPKYTMCLGAMSSLLSSSGDPDERYRIWKRQFPKYAQGLSCPSIDGLGSTVPPGIAGLLNGALFSLVAPDLLKRERSLERVRRIIWTALKCLSNEHEYQKRLKVARERRRRREEKARDRDMRLAAAMK